MAEGNNNIQSQIIYMAGLILGGLVLGFGIVSLYYSFGREARFGGVGEVGTLNGQFANVGFTGLDNIAVLSAADYSIGMVVAGVAMLVLLNANAWKYTDGY